ncbi:MAG: ABC transporter substrate-binding protein [Bacteriovoracia bacterium]
MRLLLFFSLAIGIFSACTQENDSVSSNTVLRVPITAIPDLELKRGNEINANKVIDNVFEHLVGVDESLSPIPEVASRWTIRRETNEIEFEIDRNKRFHDGSPVRSQDVLNSILEAFKNKNEILSQFKALGGCIQRTSCDGFQTLDDSRFVIRIQNKNYPLLMKKLASAKGCIVKKMDGNYLGTGPYKIVRIGDDQIIAERFDARAKFQKIIYQKLDSETAINKFLKEELDTITDVESQVNRSVLPKGLSYSQKIAGTYALVFSFKHGIFRKKENRLAVASVIDPIAFHEYAGGEDIPAGGMIPRGYVGHREKRHLIDLEMARALIEKNTTLQERNVVLGAREKFKGNMAVEKYLVGRFKDIGLNLQVQFLPFNDVLRGFREGHLHMILKGDSPINFDPSTTFDGYLGRIIEKFSGYYSPTLNRLLIDYENQTAKDHQLRVLHQMEDTFFADIPAIPLFYPVFTTWYRRGLSVKNSENMSVKFWDFSYQDVQIANLVRK